MDDREIIRSFEGVASKRVVAVVALVVVVVVALIVYVVSGFRGREISRSADAVTKAVVGPPPHQNQSPQPQPAPSR
jgi:hypothetical protein